jgi:NADH dehydrogenase [ubiquinone] 1 alpha subcomplex assembly factor 6
VAVVNKGWHHSVTGATRKGSSRVRGPSRLAALVRRHDRDRYQTALFAPAGRREALFTLYAFNYEIARVRESVTEPMLGQIRLQWWREVVDAAYRGAPPRQHEIALPLAALIGDARPSREHFDRLIDAREQDLGDEPPADMAALEDYAEGTSSRLLYLALEVLGAGGPAAIAAARDIGIAYALAGLIRALPFHTGAGRAHLPADLAVADIARTATAHLAAARRHATPRPALPALLPAIVAERFLRRLERAGCDPFAPSLAAPDPLQSWALFAAFVRNRF